MRGNLRVDDHDHSVLAMSSLTAVQPERFGIIDPDRPCSCHLRTGRNSHVTRPQAGDVAVESRWLAGLIEGALSDGVVLWCELELHHVTSGGGEG